MQRITKISRAKIVYPRFKMFQTKKYKLNLVEPSDTFSPDALNANTQKVEDVLAEKMEGPMVDLEQRVTVLEGFRFTCGVADNDEMHLGFKPLVIILSNHLTDFRLVIVSENLYPDWPEDGFINARGCRYIAFGKI